ncbi:MAG: FkbM family methyltransferase [bacterium]
MPHKDIIVSSHGLQILVRNPHESFIGRCIYLNGVWEKEVTEFILSRIKPGFIVLDIGADIGYYTLLFAKLVGPSGHVVSFEPIPKAKWYLDKNIEINKFNNVTSHSFALFDKKGYVCLEDPFHTSKINPSKQNISSNDIRVEMKVFDECAAEMGITQVNLVKIDVEGAELNILRGMRNTLQEQHPALLVEVHPQQIQTFNFSAPDIIDFLSELNYQIEPVDKPAINFDQGNITIFCR